MGPRWVCPPPAQVINPGAILACWPCLARPKAPSSRGCRRVPDPVRIEGGELPAGERGSSGNVVQSFGYRALGATACISCSRAGTPPGGCIPAGWRVAREAEPGALPANGLRRPATPSLLGLVIPGQLTHPASSGITRLPCGID
jgi:hypothetical protein